MGIFTFENMISAVRLNGLTESFLPPMVLNMSITASIMILFVLLARFVLKKAPKIFSYALWAVVLFRLLCPVSITTDFSLLGLFDTPAVENTQHTTAMEYIPYDVVHTPELEVQLPVPSAINEAVNEALPQEHAALGADPLEGEFAIGSFVWLLGIGAMAIYSAVSYFLLRRKLVGAILLRDNIYLADGIGSPFVMGFIRPKIYLPSALSEQEQRYIILHEQHHIRRGDHVIKALAFIALCIHWFNPLVWVAFILSSKDMEMSCDEAVVKKLGEEIRVDYSASLLSLATGRRIIAGTPLAFGEGDTKSRIKNMLNWKKPKTWIMLVALATCVVAIVFCATNPRNDLPKEDSMVVWELDQEYPDAFVDIVNNYVMQQVEYYNSLGSGENAIGGEYSILEAKVVGLTSMEPAPYDETHHACLYLLEYRLLPSEPSHVVLAGGMQMEGEWITEWGSTGQPYLALMFEETSEEDMWTLVGVTNTDALIIDYGTEEMIARYGSKYIAAAMELYQAYLNREMQNQYGTAEDVSYYVELAAGENFRNMGLDRQISLLLEYEDLLDDYTLIARETKDGKTAYIIGQYNGNPTESPLYGMYSVEVFTGEEDFFQFLYHEEESETVDAVLAANKKEFPSSAGYRIENSRIYWSSNSSLVLIQPKDAEVSLDVPWNRYLYTPNGREYIADAVSRGVDLIGRDGPYLYIYHFSEIYGNLSERFPLSEAAAEAILSEERVTLPEGFGFSATLHMNGETKYFYVDGENKYYDPPREGIPQSVLDLAVEKCAYTFASPSEIKGNILSARLDCDWLDAPLYAEETDLARLKEILTNAEFAFVRGHTYGGKLTLSLSGGETLTLFKDSDGFDTIVFGSYGGYFLGDKENIEFWEMFGLDPDTHARIETDPAEVEEPTGETQSTVLNVPFAAQPLGLKSPLNGMFERTYETQLRMMKNIDQSYPFFESQTLEFDSCAVLLGERMDLEDYSRSGAAYILFRDGAMQQLPLPVDANGRTVCPASVRQTDSNTLTYIVETGNNACTYTINLSDRTASMTVGAVPTAQPTETDIHNAIMTNNKWADTTSALYPYRVEAHHIWGTKQSGNRCAVYALAYCTTYEWGNGQQKRIYPEQTGSVEMVFEWDGTWQLISFWAPSEDEDSMAAIRNRFPSDIATIALGEIDSDVMAALNTQCSDAAERYYATLTDLPPAKSFTPADVEFTNKALTVGEDSMTYEERLAWLQAETPDTNPISLRQYRENSGYLAFLGQWVGTPHVGQYVFNLRFADGSLSYLPLADSGGLASALPDFMEFQNEKFIYETTFPSEEVTNEGETLIHLKGTYHYEVDLVAKTVSLTVIQ